jgi:hypothetical protein
MNFENPLGDNSKKPEGNSERVMENLYLSEEIESEINNKTKKLQENIDRNIERIKELHFDLEKAEIAKGDLEKEGRFDEINKEYYEAMKVAHEHMQEFYEEEVKLKEDQLKKLQQINLDLKRDLKKQLRNQNN